jgi:hypothetical protein
MHSGITPMVLNHTSTRCWVTHAPVGLGAMPNGLSIPSGSQTSSLIEMDMQYLSRLFCYRAKVCAAVRAALATHTWCIAPDTRSVQLHTHTAATDRTKLSRDIGAVWMYPPPSYDKSPSPSPPRRHRVTVKVTSPGTTVGTLSFLHMTGGNHVFLSTTSRRPWCA